MARPGYGKRTVTDTASTGDCVDVFFSHLPAREAYLAGVIDALPEGAAMSIKTLADAQPYYGQQAVATALRTLSTTGHLRRVRSAPADGNKLVTHTFFSRTPRPDAWWSTYLNQAPTPANPPTEPPTLPTPPPARPPKPPRSPSQPRPHSRPHSHSRAYATLAALGQVDDRVTLSAAECAALEPLASQWLARGATADHLTRSLTAGLPSEVASPGAFIRTRLTSKLPPEPSHAPKTERKPTPVRRWLVECTNCGVPGRPEALPAGLCTPCRGETPPQRTGPLTPTEVHARATHLRTAAGLS
ncbi:MarR family transcriptional regulator [Streptomyces piniterrae]|uniref:MarR family transcriptional regulator n=1 Tax=Streptomyces piniterrae TaxID=2571125 RepID=A0A4U0N8I3_9ACTN|nr:MarR family transcriptional regulator [Streptomyces piniterrae]TJZ50105.1 MarR family transcriptional regulator [Streptomyces piniterrae]